MTLIDANNCGFAVKYSFLSSYQWHSVDANGLITYASTSIEDTNINNYAAPYTLTVTYKAKAALTPAVAYTKAWVTTVTPCQESWAFISP